MTHGPTIASPAAATTAGLEETGPVVEALRRWLGRKTREQVVPWLTALGRERGLDVPGVAIRAQRTRWASCSAKGTISRNLRLLFLPKELVRYALLHDLTHIQEMNHGRRYWTLWSPSNRTTGR
jgi:predicted metal-dependent hydrolase